MTIDNFGCCIFERKKIMELELKHLAPYLPYGLKMIFEGKGGRVVILTGITDQGKYGITITGGEGSMWLNGSGFKPILRPLLDLTKEIEHNGETFVPIDYLNGEFAGKIPRKFEVNQTIRNPNIFFTLAEWISFKELHELFNLLFSWHFDVFGLIEQGLAIDKNTLD